MTTTETSKLVGCKAEIKSGTVEAITLPIRDVKSSYGKTRVLLENPNGVKAWRDLDNCKVKGEVKP